jgi:hypothetical protein
MTRSHPSDALVTAVFAGARDDHRPSLRAGTVLVQCSAGVTSSLAQRVVSRLIGWIEW